MPAIAPRAAPRKDFAACSGCSLCLLVCPAWRATRDPRTSPEGRAKALQAGAVASELAASARACTLCGACEPVCPEHIDLIGMTLGLRHQSSDGPEFDGLRAQLAAGGSRVAGESSGDRVVLICGPVLQSCPATLAKVLALINGAACEDDGADIASSIAAGVEIPRRRLDGFLSRLHAARTIVVDDGFWLRHLRAWLPGVRMTGLGEALSGMSPVRRRLRSTDLYVIEPRAYHADYERLVKHYDGLRNERGCTFNLDLQRIAIPARARSLPQSLGLQAFDDSGQADWILKGRQVRRIVVESMDDAAVFEARGGLPVVHLADLADH